MPKNSNAKQIIRFWILLSLWVIGCKDTGDIKVINLEPKNDRILNSDDIRINKVYH